MTKPITDASTGVAEAIGNKFLFGDGYTLGIYAAVSYQIYYDGAAWQVDSTMGAKKSVAGVSPAWNAGDNRLDITLSITNAFTGTPTAQATAKAPTVHGAANYTPHAFATSTTAIKIRFVDETAGTYATAQSTKMNFCLTLYGLIG